MRLLFVCCGNTCRSPMAARLAQKMLKGHVQAESAGIAPSRDRATDGAIRVMAEEGIDLSDHRPRDVADLSLDDFDYVVGMDPSVHRYIKKHCRIAPNRLISWDIDDPYGQETDAYTRCIQAIGSHIKDLVTQLGLPSAENRPRRPMKRTSTTKSGSDAV
ncbi:MAG: low molecular weight phosphatase family protein [Candidatus Methylomirabilales bacterium]